MKREQDARLIALGDAWAEAERRDRAAWRKRDRLEERAREQGLSIPPLLVFENQHCADESMVLARCRPDNPKGPSRKEGRRVWAEFHATEVAYEKRRRELGLGPIDAEAKRSRRAWRRSMLALIAAPAQSVHGIAIKLRTIKDDFRDGHSSYSDRMLRSALRDAERLGRRT